MGKILLIRVDASPEIGTGHVMRCLALAQAWQEAGARTLFASIMESPPLDDRLRSEGMEVMRLKAIPGSSDDAKQTARLALSQGAAYVVTDGYHFGINFQRILRENHLPLLYIDDVGYTGTSVANIILNQNISATESLYHHRLPETQLLLGSRYALLRREFREWRRWRRNIPVTATKVLVTLGGSDLGNATLKVLWVLKKLELSHIQIRIVIGGNNPNISILRQALRDTKGNFELIVNTTKMPELMAWADLAITAGGSTCWEMALMGLPMMILIIANNQQKVTEHLEQNRIAINLGWQDQLTEKSLASLFIALLADAERRLEMSRLGQRLVDGLGALRVSNMLRKEICKQLKTKVA